MPAPKPAAKPAPVQELHEWAEKRGFAYSYDPARRCFSLIRRGG